MQISNFICWWKGYHFQSSTSFIYRCCCFLIRIAELFEIIVDYPESEPALNDLAVCLKRVEIKGLLISSLDKRFAYTIITTIFHYWCVYWKWSQLIPAILSNTFHFGVPICIYHPLEDHFGITRTTSWTLTEWKLVATREFFRHFFKAGECLALVLACASAFPADES